MRTSCPDDVRRWVLPMLLATCTFGSTQARAIDVSTVDVIPDSLRTNFNSFEGAFSSQPIPQYEEDGILVEEVDGTGWGRADGPCGFDIDGNRCWWVGQWFCPGYSRITRSDGSDFINVGLLLGTPLCPVDIFKYVLREGGAVVDSGTVARTSGTNFVGFYGGGFDEVLLRGHIASQQVGFFSGTNQWLVLDAIELSDERGIVSEPFVINVVATAYGADENAKLPVQIAAGTWLLSRVSPATHPDADYFSWTANRDSPAWRTPFTFRLQSGLEGGGGYCCADTPEDAFLATPDSLNSFSFTLPTSQIVEFWIDDGILWDNDGGVSLVVEAVSTEVAPTATRNDVSLRAFPNPSTTQLWFDCSYPRGPGTTSLSIFDADGRLIERLLPAASRALVQWSGQGADGARLASGVYFVRLEASGGTATTRVTLIR